MSSLLFVLQARMWWQLSPLACLGPMWPGWESGARNTAWTLATSGSSTAARSPPLPPARPCQSLWCSLCYLLCYNKNWTVLISIQKGREGREGKRGKEREREGKRGKRRKEMKRGKGREAELCLTFKEMRRKAHILGLDSQCKIFQRLCLNQSLKSLKSLY